MPRVRAMWVIAALLALVLAACRAAGDDVAPPTTTVTDATATAALTPTAEPAPAVLNGTRWLLSSLHGAGIGSRLTIELSFTIRQAGGYIGCSSYGGAYTSGADGSFAMPEVFTNSDLCDLPDELASFAETYFGALESAAGYRVIDERLELHVADGAALIFAPDTRDALDGTAWFVGSPFGARPIIDNTHMTAEFSDGRISGLASCNDYSGSYSVGEDGSFSVGGLVVTEMACAGPEDIMAQEQRFLDALTTATSFEYDVLRDQIELFDATGQLRMRLHELGERLPMGLPAWTAWVLTDMHGQVVDIQPKITMLFSNGLLGDAGCLSYSAIIVTRPNGEVPYLHGSFPYSPMDWYDGECGPAGPSPEALAYRAALESVAFYSLASDRFEFLNANGDVVLGYAPSLTEGTGLEDTSWSLLSLKGAPVIEGTEITLNVSDSAIQGSAGCNGYYGPFVISEPGHIAFFQIVSTSMGCAEPPGIEAQEQAYHAALGEVDAYRVTGTRLELFNADGVVLLVFECADL